MKKQMTEREQLQREQSKKALLALLVIPFTVLFLIIGIISEDTNEALFFLCIILSIASSVIGCVLVVKILKKYTPLIVEAFVKEVKEQLRKTEGKTEFTTENGDIVSFDRDALICNGERISYSKVGIYITLRIAPKALSNDITFATSIVFEDERPELDLFLDGDILMELDKKGVTVENMEDLRHYLKNYEEFTKRLLRSTPKQLNVCYVPLALPKNEEEKQAVKRINRKAIILSVLSFVGAVAVYALVTWLFNSKSGTQISDTFTFNLGYKLVFTLIVLLLIFVKPKATKLYVKLLFGAFIVLYWSALLFLSQRMISLVFLLFAIVFMCIGIFDMSKNKDKPDPRTRTFVFGVVLCLFLLADVTSMTMINDEILFLDLIMGIIALVVSIPIIVIFMRKTTKSTYQKKGQKIGYGILYAVGAFFFTMVASFLLTYEVNYIFDASEPTEITEEIIELKIDDDDYQAIVEIDGEEVKVSIPSSDYYKLALGDKITLSLYDGALGFEYYIYEE